MISPGVHVISPNTTVDAAVRVSPTPAALMDKMATRTESSSWKRLTRRERSDGGVLPSMRMNLNRSICKIKCYQEG